MINIPTAVRVVLLSFAAIATLLLGLDKSGITPVVDGSDVGFAWTTRPSSHGSELVLTSDAGDLNSWLLLHVRVSGAIGTSVKAALANGQALSVRAAQVSQDILSLEISDGKAGSMRGEKFKWAAGFAINVLFPGMPAPAVTLQDWTVYIENKQSDSLDRAKKRWWWHRISLGLAVVAAIGAVIAVLPKSEEGAAFTLEFCVRALISGIEMPNKKATKRARKLLRRVLLERVPPKEAVSALGLSFAENSQVWFAARRAFLERLEWLIPALHETAGHLSWR